MIEREIEKSLDLLILIICPSTNVQKKNKGNRKEIRPNNEI